MSTKITISSREIDPGQVFKQVANKRSGGSAFFIGTVRSNSSGMNVTRMHLETAKELATADLKRICREASKKFDINDISVAHRIGDLRVGDVIVVIGVGAAHRKDAFGACKHIIDELKKTTPIWKKEIGSRGERWARRESSPDD